MDTPNPFFTSDFPITEEMLDRENGYDEAAIKGLFSRCMFCGDIKASELFWCTPNPDYVICECCYEVIKD